MISGQDFLEALRQHNILEQEQLDRLTPGMSAAALADARALADELCRRNLLTPFQADEVLQGHAAELVLGVYVLLDKLGEGGMGAVYRALHTRLKAVRAVKIIRPDAITSRRAIDRFYRESQAVAKLKHPNIILAHDANEDGDRHYFVMEYTPGRDLARLLRERGRLPVAEACEYIRQAALGLQHAHEQGMVHRDIKPSNLLLATEEKLVKILDLGLARLREAATESQDADPITPNGMLMGTPDYMAPEQAENSSGVDIRADIYSLGCSLYQLLTGSVPFAGGSLADKLRRHYCEEPPRLATVRSDAPPGLAAVVAKMMAKTPQQRYQTPAEVAEALRPFSALTGDAAPSHSPLTRSPDAGGDSQTPLIPQTLEMPGTLAPNSGTQPDLAEDGVTTRQVPATRTSVLTPARPRRRLWLPAALLLLAGGGVAAALLWPGSKEPPPRPVADAAPTPPAPRVVEPDLTKRPPPPQTNKEKPPERVVPVTPTPPARGTARGSAPGEGYKGVARSGNGGAHTVKGRKWRRVETVYTFPASARRVAFSRDGRRAAVLGASTVTLYDPTRKAKPDPVSLLERLGNRVDLPPVIADVALSADGSRLLFSTLCRSSKPLKKGGAALLTLYDTVAEWDRSGLRLFFIGEMDSRRGRMSSIQCFAISPDGKALLTGNGTKLSVWNLSRAGPENEEEADVLPLSERPDCVVYAPDGSYAAVGARDGVVRLCLLKAGGSGVIGEWKSDAGGVRCIAFTSDAHLLSGHAKGALLVWGVPKEMKAGEAVAPLLRLEKWHSDAIACIASAPGSYFASGGADGFVCLGKVGDKQPLWREASGGTAVKALAFSTDGRHVLFATEKGIGRLAVQPLSEGETRAPAAGDVPLATAK